MKKTLLAAAAGILAVVGTGCERNPASPSKEPYAKVTVLRMEPGINTSVRKDQKMVLTVRVEYDLDYGGALAELVFHNAKNPANIFFTVAQGRKQLPSAKSGIAELTFETTPGNAVYGVLTGETLDFVYVEFSKGVNYPGTYGQLAFSDPIALNWRIVY